MNYFTGLSFACLTGIIVIVGDVVLKVAADRSGPGIWTLVGLGCLIYAASAVLWFWAMRHATLAQAGVAYSMFTLLALALIGAIWFKESLGPRDWAGIGFALTSMVMMARFE